MLLVVLLGVFGAALAPVVTRRWREASGWILALVPALAFAYFASFIPAVAGGAVIRSSLAWLPQAGVSMSLALDGLSLVFALLICGLGAVIVVYAGSYLSGDPRAGAFQSALLAFMAAMLGVVLADDVIVLFVFWELTGLCSFLLIGHKHALEGARTAARQAFVVTAAGGLALLAGLLLIGHAAGGTFSITEILDRGDAIRQHELYIPAFILIAIGAFTKSAQVPFHFWLPKAMAAPTPASAYLHSATMVKAGVYLLARMDRGLGDTTLWVWTLSAVGGATMIVGAVQAIREVDQKRILANSTLTALGTLVFLLGLSFGASIKAAIVFLLVHSLYKAALFMIAGIVERSSGTRDVRHVSGLARAQPWTAAAAALAGLSMAGLPPLVGFIGKELTYKAKLGFEAGGWLLPAVAVLANGLTAAAAGILVIRPFFGTRSDELPRARVARALRLGPIALAAVGLALGILPTVASSVVAPAAAAVAGEPVPIHLSLWYGVTTALLLSGITVVIGTIVYLGWCKWHPRGDRIVRPGLGPRAFDALLEAVSRAGSRVASMFEAMGTAAVAGCATALTAVLVGMHLVPEFPPIELERPSVIHVALAITCWAGSIAAAVARVRLAALVSLGVVGLALSLWFAMLGAIDLAMTQLLVETVIVVVAVRAFRSLPAPPDRRSPGRRVLHLGIAVAAGLAATIATLAVLAQPMVSPAADYFVTHSVSDGHGRNVVNVILVDFRALDTLGEIAVLVLGCVAVGKLASGFSAASGESRRESLILRTATKALLPVLLVYALFLLFRGHNAPGGGFIAGLVVIGALLVHAIAHGSRSVADILPIRPLTIGCAGLLLALAAGLIAAAAGTSFLTGQWTTLAGVKLGTPLLFDVGVFLVVIGFGLGVGGAIGASRKGNEGPCSSL